jgi:hypothetical protein
MPFPIVAAASALASAVPAIAGLFGAGKQKKLAKSINPQNSIYTESPYTKALYGVGANLYKGRMSGATAAEQNISTNAANTNANVSRNAGDASTALAMAAGIQGQADNAYGNLAIGEAADKLNRFGVYSDVTQQMTRERDKVHEDKLRRYYDDLNYKRALEGAAMQNSQNAFNKVGELGMAGLNLWANGAFDKKDSGNFYGRSFSGQEKSSVPQINTRTPSQTFGGNIPSTPNNIPSRYVWQRPQVNYNSWGN